MRRGLHKIPLCHLRETHELGGPVADLVAAGLKQQVVKPELVSFGDPPTMHLLAAHAVAVRDLALEDKDAHSVFGEPLRERGTGQAAADRDHVVSLSHADFQGRAAPHAANTNSLAYPTLRLKQSALSLRLGNSA